MVSKDETVEVQAEETPVPVKRGRKAAAKPEVVAEAPPVETKEVDTSIAEATDSTPVKTSEKTAADVETAEGIKDKPEYEFLEELPNKQQAAPVTEAAEGVAKENRVTKAIDGDETEPKLVDHDKAFDLETQQTPAGEGKPEPEPAPAEVDQPEVIGVSKTTDTRVTAYIEEGETEPKPVDHEDTFAEDHHNQPNPGKVGGEGPRYDTSVYAADTTEAEKPKGKAKTTNPKLKRLSKYKD